MRLADFAQEFTDQDSGEVERITAEPLEFYTAAGWEIIPAGFRFRFRTVPAFLRPEGADEIFILHEWQYTAGNRPRLTADGIMRRELIKYTRKERRAPEGRFWRFVRTRAKVEAAYIWARAFGWRYYK